MSNGVKFEDKSGLYSLIIEGSEVKLECYLLGISPSGEGTECSHTIGSSKIADFLAALAVTNVAHLLGVVATYDSDKWREFHEIAMKNQTDVFVWTETDWSDSIEIKASFSGEARVGSVLTASASATLSGRTLPATFQWYSNDTIDGSYHSIESANEDTYLLNEIDRGSYIRVGISSSDEIGFNSAFSPTKSVGPVD